MKNYIIELLENQRGDNLIRARHAFSSCTPEQMQEEYGQSGKTRQQILDDYEAYDAQITAAINWVNQQ